MIALFIGNPTASGINFVQLAGKALAAPARHLKLVAPALSLAQGENGVLTVASYCEQHGVNVSVRDMSRIGRRAATLSRKGGQLIGKVHEGVFGEVNAYDPLVVAEARRKILDEIQRHSWYNFIAQHSRNFRGNTANSSGQ